MYRVLRELLPEDRFESGAPTRSAAPPTGPVQRQQFLPVHLLVLTPPLGRVGTKAGAIEFQDDGMVNHPVDDGSGTPSPMRPARGRWPGTIRVAGGRGSSAEPRKGGASEVFAVFGNSSWAPRGAREGHYSVVLGRCALPVGWCYALCTPRLPAHRCRMWCSETILEERAI